MASTYLTIASINCCPIGTDRLHSGKNSLLSYFIRIHFSLSSREDDGDGLIWPGRNDVSHTEFARLFPIASITLIWQALQWNEWTTSARLELDSIDGIVKNTHVQSSRPSERTLLMCEPRFRWTPEHSMHMRTPKLRLAHSGFGASQSTQKLLPGTRFLIDCIDAKSVDDCCFDFDDMFDCSSLNISCSMTFTHSSRSSELAASKCHCLPSNDTM